MHNNLISCMAHGKRHVPRAYGARRTEQSREREPCAIVDMHEMARCHIVVHPHGQNIIK